MGKNRKKGKKKKTCPIDPVEEQFKGAPHSFVFHRGHVGKNVKQLVADTRLLMEPFTAKNLQVRKKNVLKDFVNVAGMLHVTHFMIFTKTDVGVYMRLCRLPRGPTLTFKVHNYCLAKDVISSLRKPNLEQMQFMHHPLVVMNNFSGEENHIKLMSSMFQNLFPSINIHKVKLNDVKRCVMVNYHSDSHLLDFRHFNIKVVPVGMSRGVKKLVQSRVPNLGKYGDISEYMTRAGYSSESEVELDGPMNEVVLPQHIRSRGNIKSAKSAVRLTELGPRLTLELVKIEEGICEGPVLYHAFITRTQAELAQQAALRDKKQKLKEARRQQQAANVARKEEEKGQHKERSLEGIRRILQEEKGDEAVEEPNMPDSDEGDDDVEYFKQEVGQMPDKDSFIPGGVKRKKQQKSHSPAKMKKIDSSNKLSKLVTDRKDVKFNKVKNMDSKTDSVVKGKGQNDKNNQSKRANMTPMQKMMERKKKKKKMKEKKKTLKMRKGGKKK